MCYFVASECWLRALVVMMHSGNCGAHSLDFARLVRWYVGLGFGDNACLLLFVRLCVHSSFFHAFVFFGRVRVS